MFLRSELFYQNIKYFIVVWTRVCVEDVPISTLILLNNGRFGDQGIKNIEWVFC